MLLAQFFTGLFTDGAVCGEVVLSPAGDRIDRFYFIDPATIEFIPNRNGQLELYQVTEDRPIRLNPHSTFYFGLDTDVANPRGRSLLSGIPFVTRVEQQLVADMQKTMHNAGYHRLHVKIKPPEKKDAESDDAYVARANRYFEDTVGMMKKIAPEDNPVTWNEVEIAYIGPTGQYAGASGWYLNHKAMVEDIASGTHLDPFMLGYSYGTTQHWAGFKLELVERQVISVQRPAKRFVEWLHNLELALHGLDLRAEHHFDNRRTFGLLEARKAEQMHLDNVLKQQRAGFLTFDEAKQRAFE